MASSLPSGDANARFRMPFPTLKSSAPLASEVLQIRMWELSYATMTVLLSGANWTDCTKTPAYWHFIVPFILPFLESSTNTSIFRLPTAKSLPEEEMAKSLKHDGGSNLNCHDGFSSDMSHACRVRCDEKKTAFSFRDRAIQKSSSNGLPFETCNCLLVLPVATSQARRAPSAQPVITTSPSQ